MATRIESSLFEGLVRENADMLFTYIRSLVSDELLREEVFQETVVVAWQRLASYDPARPIGAWLRGIARKTSLAKLRERGAHRSLDDATLAGLEERFASLAGQPGETFDEKLECLRACLKVLSDRDREAIRLRYEDGLRGAPLAEGIGVGLENAKKIVQRARQRLHACIERRLSPGEVA